MLFVLKHYTNTSVLVNFLFSLTKYQKKEMKEWESLFYSTLEFQSQPNHSGKGMLSRTVHHVDGAQGVEIELQPFSWAPLSPSEYLAEGLVLLNSWRVSHLS